MGLIAALALFVYIDFKELFHLFTRLRDLEADDGYVFLLTMVDLAMVAFLVKLIIVGSYSSFYKKHEDGKKTDPNLNTSSGVLKVKIATALIGVTSIDLLKHFLKPAEIPMEDLQKKIIIHGVLLIGALVLGFIDWLHVKSEAVHHQDCICCKEAGINQH